MLKYTRHPLSALLPALTADEIDGMRISIEAIGVQEPATLFDGQILDGWNRYTLADELGVDCPLRPLPSGIDPVEFVRSTTRRRHMTLSALALLEVQLNDWRASGERGRGEAASPLGATTAQMAANVGASERTIEKAKAASRATEAVHEAIRAGKLSVEKGAKIAKLPEGEQAAALTAPPPVPKFGAAPPVPPMPPAADDPGFLSPTDLAEEQEAEIRRLTEQLAAASADDKAAELIKLKTMLQVAERRQGELMADAARLQGDLRTASNTIRQLCDLLDLQDTRKVVAAVKALVAAAKATKEA